MEWLIAGIAGTASGVIAGVIVNEIYAKANRVSNSVIRRAVRRLPLQARSRYEEEWTAHSEALGNSIARLWHAAGCFAATFNASFLGSASGAPTLSLNQVATLIAKGFVAERGDLDPNVITLSEGYDCSQVEAVAAVIEAFCTLKGLVFTGRSDDLTMLSSALKSAQVMQGKEWKQLHAGFQEIINRRDRSP